MPNNNSGSHRTSSSPSSRYNSGNSRRPSSYSERYNRPNPYTGYLPPGTASPEKIYHPESVDPVRIKQLEREQEQARLHAYEDKANMPHSANNTANTQQTKAQMSRSSSSRSAQDASRRGKQTRRAQVAQQHAARAAAYRAPVTVGNNPHLDEIRQSAIDEAEKLRNQPVDEIPAPAAAEPVPTEAPESPKESFTAGLPVAGAAQFAAHSLKTEEADVPDTSAATPVIIDAEPEESEEERTDSASVMPIIVTSSAVEVITSDTPSDTEVTDVPEAAQEPIESDASYDSEVAEDIEESETTEIVEESETAEEDAESTEESENSDDVVPITGVPLDEPEEGTEETSADAEEPNNISEESSDTTEISDDVIEADSSEDNTEPEEETVSEVAADSDNNTETEVVEDEAEPSEVKEAVEECPDVEDTEEEASTDDESPEDDISEDDDEDDVKVYVSPEKKAEDSENYDDFDDEYYEYEDDDDYEEDIATTPVAAVPVQNVRRRNFETRISSELADPSAYSPGVAQDETLFIRKKRPEEATAVFAASTPGLAPDFDDDDFFEQWLEEGDDMIIKDKRQRRRVSAIIGGATMLFAIIGFIFVVVWFINSIPGSSKTSGSQTDYAKFILPVVNADPEPFETITSVDNNILVEAAINRLTYGEAAADQTYTALEVENETRLQIPAADVEKSGKVLFGDTFTIDYTVMYAIEDEKIYYYSAADDCFHVITTGGDIEPEIIKISHIGSRTQVLLEVGYISASEEAMEGSDYYKMMEYVLNAKEDGGYYVSAIRAIEED